jgi:aspartate racemase
MSHHIGIVACSAEGAALCYRTICVEGAQLLGPHAHPEVSMHTHSLSEYMNRIYGADRQGVAELMLASANKLAKIDADFLTLRRDRPCPGCTSPRWSPLKPSTAASAASA